MNKCNTIKSTSGALKQFALGVAVSAAVVFGSGLPARAADYPTTVQSYHPVGYWRLNETTPLPVDPATNAGTAGAAVNGAYRGGASHPVAPGALAGDTDPAARFDGSSQYVEVPYSAALNPASTITVEFWAKLDVATSGAKAGVVSRYIPVTGGPAGQRGYLFFANNGNTKWQFRVYNGTGGVTVTDVNGPNILANTWYHVTGVYDGTQAHIYVNGVESSPATTGGYVANTNTPLRIGAGTTETAPSLYFPGTIDEVAVYPTALSAAQIAAHYNAGINPAPPTPYTTLVRTDGPSAYWRLNDPAISVPAANLGSLGTAATGSYTTGTVPGSAGPPSPPFAGLGAGNYACQFASGPIVCGNNTGFNLPQMSVAAWLKINSLTMENTIVAKGAGWRLYVDNSIPTAPTLVWSDGVNLTSGTRNVKDGQWHLVVAVSDGTTSSLYVDGTLDGSGATGLPVNTDVLTIGSQGAFANAWNGSLDEVAIFNTALTEPQVLALYKSALDLSAANILTFNPNGVITGTNIFMTVPHDADLTTLSPTYTVSPLATGTPASGTTLDFSSPQTYTVTAENGSTKAYRVKALKSAAPWLNVNIDNTPRTGLVGPAGGLGTTWNQKNQTGGSALLDVNGVATTASFTTTAGGVDPWDVASPLTMLISAALNFGKNTPANLVVTNLPTGKKYDLWIACYYPNEAGGKGQFSTTNAMTTVGTQYCDNAGGKAGSGNDSTWVQGANCVLLQGVVPDANNKITVTFVSGDNDYRSMVNGFQLVEALPPNQANMLTFGPGAVITGHNIAWTVPFASDVTTLAPTYTVSYGAVGVPASGNAMDFTTPQTYTVISGDDTVTNVYTVTVTKAPDSSAKDILTFGPGAVITGTNIAWTVLYSSDVTTLAPTYTVSPLATGVPASGDVVDFSTPQIYTVTAENLSTKAYTVTVTKAPPSSAKDMLTFGPGAIITGTNIAWTVPNGTDLTTLAPTYTVSPYATGAPLSGDVLDFTSPQIYTVTAENGSTKTYTVTVTHTLPPWISVNIDIADRTGLIGPVGGLGTTWNQHPQIGASALLDVNGVATTVGFTTTAGGVDQWDVASPLTMLTSAALNFAKNTPSDLILSGLPTGKKYDLYIACYYPNEAGGKGQFTTTNTTTTVGTQYCDNAGGNAGGGNDSTWVEGANYVRFANLQPGPAGNITVTFTSGDINYRSMANGFQLVDRGGVSPNPTITGFTGPVAGKFTIQGTTDIAGNVVTVRTPSLTPPIVWTPVQTNAVPGGVFGFQVPQGAGAAGFFRLLGQ